jgi:hypothetical protein
MSPDIPLRTPGTFPDISLQSGPTEVPITKTSAWSILKEQSSTKTSAWDIRFYNQRTPTSSWNILKENASQKTCNWTILIKNATQIDSDWIITHQDSEQKTSSWDLLKERSTTKTTNWEIELPGQKLISSEWRITTENRKTKVTNWDIYFQGRQIELDCSWIMKGMVNKVSRWVLYREDSPISNTTNFTSPDGFLTVKNSRAVRDKRGRIYIACIYKNASTDNIMLLWDDGVDDWAFKFLTTDTGLTADLKYSVSMDIDRSGNIHVAYDCISYNYSSYGRYIRYIKYDPVADSILVNKDVVYYNATYPQKHPHLQVDDSDYAHILWLGKGWSANPTYFQVCYARSDEITRWSGSPPSALTADTADNSNQWINVDSNDVLHAYWIGLGATNNPTVNNVCRKTKAGGSWSSRQWITDVATAVVMSHSVFDKDDNIYLGYRGSATNLYYTKYNNTTSTWSTPESAGSSNIASYSMQVGFNGEGDDAEPVFLFYSNDSINNSRLRLKALGTWTDIQLSNSPSRSQLNCDLSIIQPSRGNWVSVPSEKWGVGVYFGQLDDTPVTTTYHLYTRYYNFGAWADGWITSSWTILDVYSSNKVSAWVMYAAHITTLDCNWVIPKKGMCFVVFCG